MILCCSRQWHVLGLSAARQRSFAHRASLYAPAKTALSTRNSAIIIPNRVTGTLPSDFIKYIEPLDRRYFKKDRIVVLFVTPAFANWIFDQQNFLQQALRRVYRNVFQGTIAAPNTTVLALVAVVDKLPMPHAIKNVDDLEEEALCRTRTPPVSDSGHEGLAYTTLRPSDFQYRARTNQDEKGSITFVNSGRSQTDGSYTDFVQLPLANTIFHTGKPTTMFLTAWKKAEDSEDLQLNSETELTELVLRLRRDRGVEQQQALAVPLIPMTVPRAVEGSMGNIIRRVIGADGRSTTASEELERVVNQYFKSRNEAPQAMSVWALVIPPVALKPVLHETEKLFAKVSGKESADSRGVVSPPWGRLWSSDPPKWNDLVTVALSKGARLHRVLSGGGGWGKKAGLLSLDPSTTAEGLSAPLVQDYPGDNGEAMDLSSALGQVVHPGDSIQFFASPPAPAIPQEKSSKNNRDQLAQLKRAPTHWMWEVGTIPSSTDELPNSSWQHRDSSGKLEIYPIPNSFGALSEGGMTVTRKLKLESGDSTAEVGTTKIDVPYSRFSSVNLRDQNGEESDLGEESAQRALHIRSQQLGDGVSNVPIRRVLGSKIDIFKLTPMENVDKPLAMKRPVASQETVVESKKTPAVRIGKYTMEIPDSTLCERRLEGIIRVVSVEEQRASAILLRCLSARLLAIAEACDETCDKLLGEAMHAINNHYRALAKRLKSRLQRSEDTIKMLRTNLVGILLKVDHKASSSNLKYELEAISSLIHESEARLANTTLRIRLRRDTNASAVTVYVLHTVLRRRFGRIIRTGRGNLPAKVVSASKLKSLRTFNENLFVGFKAPSHRFFMDKLLQLQKQQTSFDSFGVPGSVTGKVVDDLDGREGVIPKRQKQRGKIQRINYKAAPRYGPRRLRYSESVRGLRLRRVSSRSKLRRVSSVTAGESQELDVPEMKTHRKREAKKRLWEEISSWLS